MYEVYVYVNPLKPCKIESKELGVCFLFEPYYVGKGSIKYKRYYCSLQHSTNPYLRNTISNIRKSIGENVSNLEMRKWICRFGKFKDENVAYDIEEKVIAEFKRKNRWRYIM